MLKVKGYLSDDGDRDESCLLFNASTQHVDLEVCQSVIGAQTCQSGVYLSGLRISKRSKTFSVTTRKMSFSTAVAVLLSVCNLAQRFVAISDSANPQSHGQRVVL